MKKFSILILALVLSVSLAACGRRDKTNTEPTGDTSMIPGVDPTIVNPTVETNIPDHNVDSSIPDTTADMTLPHFTDGTDPTNTTKESVR